MKNYSKHAMFLMVAVLATSLFSCNKDDEGDSPNNTNALEKTSVAFNVVDGAKSNLTGKDIKRGTIDAKIKSINLTATKLWTNGSPQVLNYAVSDVFDILNSSDSGYAAADANISLQDVAIGTNLFTASTTAAGAQVSNLFHYQTTFISYAITDALADQKLNDLKAELPYATYVGEVTADIFKPDVAANNVVIPMTTENGRINATFNLSELLVKLEYTATLTVKTYKANGTLITTFPSKLIDNGDIVTFQWNDINSTDGAYATYQIDIREKNNNTIYYTYTFNDATSKINKAISRSCRYVVNKESILVNLEGADGFKFTTPWDEVNCPTCPNLVP